MSDGWARIRLTLPNSFVDWVSAEVVEWGSPGVEVLDTRLETDSSNTGQMTLDIYFPAISAEESRLKLKSFLVQLGQQVEPYTLGEPERTPDVDWAEQWRYHFPPLELGSRLLILPPWEREQDSGSRIPILLQPGMAFGTGHHPTTALILEQLEKTISTARQGTILDVGCGSGILSMGAVALGAGSVLAIDYDRDAVESAASNIEMNEMADRIQVVQAKFPALPTSQTFDIVVANVYYTFFRMESLAVSEVMEKGSVLLASGLRDAEGGAVVDILRSMAFSADVVAESDGWVVIQGVKH
ncbi:50S ribosomal protein L11 methyltransferase [Candidatus Zixiibacteriota bacterium]